MGILNRGIGRQLLLDVGGEIVEINIPVAVAVIRPDDPLARDGRLKLTRRVDRQLSLDTGREIIKVDIWITVAVILPDNPAT